MSVSDKAEVVVVGGGSFGTALAVILGDLGRSVRMWVRREEQADEINRERSNGRYLPGRKLPERVFATTDMKGAIRGVPVVLLVVPSKSFRLVAREVGEHLQGDQVLVHGTKGIEIETFRRMSQVLREETCALKVGVLSGPNLAGEMMAGHPAGSVVASRYDEVVRAVQRLFAGGHLRVYGGRDVVGVEIGGAFKNVIAIAAGVADGLGFGDNARSLLVTRGLSEMALLGVSMGGDVFTFGGLAGVGDLMATCASPASRNHQVGEKIAQGKTLEEVLADSPFVAEGIPTTRAVYLRAKQKGLHLPITEAVHAVLYEGKTAADALSSLMALPVGDELSALRY
jgi:glycerol-3-phosphate dehydrogenase (NAD(P)+)